MPIEIVNPLELPSLSIQKVYKLPQSQGIYFVISEKQVLYIGYSLNFRKRWRNHHRYQELVKQFTDIKVSWLVVKDVSASFLRDLESLCIDFWKPVVNSTKIKLDADVEEDLSSIPIADARLLQGIYQQLKVNISKEYASEIKDLKEENQLLRKEIDDLKLYLGVLKHYYRTTQEVLNKSA